MPTKRPAAQTRKARWLRFGSDRSGLAAIEFAFVLPLAILMLFGEFTLGEALSINRKVAIASHTIADLVARQQSVSANDLSNFMGAVAQIASPYSSANMTVVVSELSTDNNGNTTVTWSSALNTTALTAGNAFSPPAGLAQNNSSLIYAQVTYAYTPAVGQNIFGIIPISNTFYMPPRITSVVQYTN